MSAIVERKVGQGTTCTLAATPTAGAIVVLALTSAPGGDPLPGAEVTYTVGGAGGTWTRAHQSKTAVSYGSPHEVWVGTGLTGTAIAIAAQKTNGGSLTPGFAAWVVTDADVSSVTAQTVAMGGAGTLAGPAMTAGAGALVMNWLSEADFGGNVYPVSVTPASGWSAASSTGLLNGWATGRTIDRASTESATHQVTASKSSAGGENRMTQIVVGVAAEPAAPAVTLTATRQRRTGSFNLSPVAPPVADPAITLAGARRRRTATFALVPVSTDGSASATLAGVRQRRVATFTTAAVVPVAPAPIVAASGHAVVVAQAFGPVTMRGAQPVYSIEQAATPRARQRIVVDGVDRSYFRGGILPDVTYTLVSPLLYGPGELEVPQVSACFERLGVGELLWLREGANVVVDRVLDDVVVGTDYKGVIVAFDTSGRTLKVELGGEAAGRAALRNRQVPIFPRVNDIGHQIDDAVRDLGLPTLPHLGPVTGIETMTTGGTGHLEHIQNLVSRAFTKAGRQWTVMPDENGIYRTKRKDVTTVHATAFTDDARTVANLRRDVAEEPNRIFGTGVTPQGQRVRNGVYPGLIQGKAPAFPGPMKDGDTGEAVQVLINRLWAVGYLGLRDAAGGYDDDVHDAVFDLQTDAGFFDDGFGGTDPGWVDEKTWRALYDLDVTGASLEAAHIEPMAQRRKVRKWSRSGSGTITKLNPVYDPEALVVDRNIDFGAGLKRRQMFNRSLAELHDSDEPNWVGDITFAAEGGGSWGLLRGQVAVGAVPTPADVMDPRELQPGMNLWLPQFDGGTLVHVSACQVDGDGKVTATVDTRFRDSMEVWGVIARNKESRRDPARNRDREHRSSTIVKDSIGEWDEIGGMLGNDVDLEPGWNVVRVVGAAEGTIARIRLLVQTVGSGNVISVEPHEFACAVFGREIGPGTLANLVPQPLTVEGSKAWEKRADDLEDRWLLYAAGTHDEPCGYSPGRKHWKSVTTEEPNPDYDPTSDPDSAKVVEVTTQESWGVLTGKHVDDASFAYRSEERTWLYVAVWVAKPTTLHAGRIMWPQLEAGV